MTDQRTDTLMEKAVLIRKVLLNEASDEERGELNAWIASDPRHADEFEDLKLLYEASADEKDMEGSEEFYEPFKKIQASIKRVKEKERQLIFYKTAGVSVAIYCLIFVVVYFFNGKVTTDNDEQLSGITLSAELKFTDAPLSTIFDAIEKKNQIVFTAGKEQLLTCRFTGTFCKGMAIEDVVDVLAESEGFQYAFTVDNVVLTGKGCSR
jgi:hypothetical protein